MVVMDEVPTHISDTLTPNISSLQAGHYYVIFQMGSQIEVRNFIKQ